MADLPFVKKGPSILRGTRKRADNGELTNCFQISLQRSGAPKLHMIEIKLFGPAPFPPFESQNRIVPNSNFQKGYSGFQAIFSIPLPNQLKGQLQKSICEHCSSHQKNLGNFEPSKSWSVILYYLDLFTYPKTFKICKKHSQIFALEVGNREGINPTKFIHVISW